MCVKHKHSVPDDTSSSDTSQGNSPRRHKVPGSGQVMREGFPENPSRSQGKTKSIQRNLEMQETLVFNDISIMYVKM